MLNRSQGHQHVQNALHVCAPAAQGIGIAAPHQRLGGQVQHHLRLAGGDRCRQGGRMANVAEAVATAQPGDQAQGSKQRLAGRLHRLRRQGQASDLSPQLQQPEGQSDALKAGVAGEQHPAAVPKHRGWTRRGGATHHTVKGAWPLTQSSSTRERSRNVTIGAKT